MIIPIFIQKQLCSSGTNRNSFSGKLHQTANSCHVSYSSSAASTAEQAHSSSSSSSTTTTHYTTVEPRGLCNDSITTFDSGG
jgi:hypothetical protein